MLVWFCVCSCVCVCVCQPAYACSIWLNLLMCLSACLTAIRLSFMLVSSCPTSVSPSFFPFLSLLLSDRRELCVHLEELVVPSGCRDLSKSSGGVGGAWRSVMWHRWKGHRELWMLGQEEEEKERTWSGGKTGQFLCTALCVIFLWILSWFSQVHSASCSFRMAGSDSMIEQNISFMHPICHALYSWDLSKKTMCRDKSLRKSATSMRANLLATAGNNCLITGLILHRPTSSRVCKGEAGLQLWFWTLSKETSPSKMMAAGCRYGHSLRVHVNLWDEQCGLFKAKVNESILAFYYRLFLLVMFSSSSGGQ